MSTNNRMRVLTDDGIRAVDLADPAERTLTARHLNAVQRFLATGDIDVLEPFEDRQVAGLRLMADPDELEAWAAQGELEFEDIYDATGR